MPRRYTCSLAANVAVLSVVVALFFGHPIAFAGEGNWVCEAARLIGRFESIAAEQMSQTKAHMAYAQLLGETSKMAQAGVTTSGDGRSRAAFSAWLSQRIYEQVGNVAAANDMRKKYEALRDALPEEEASTFRLLFERLEIPDHKGAQGVCDVEARGKDIRVTAINCPIDDLLRQMAQAAQEKIEIPSGVCGRADYEDDKWRRVDHALSLFAKPRGLFVKGEVGEGFSVRIVDPLYFASLGERAGKWPRITDAVRQEKGVPTGFVILHGSYVEPPYSVELRTSEAKVGVCINGLEIGRAYSLTQSVPARAPAVELPPNGQFSLETPLPLLMYTGQLYQARARVGEIEAKQEVAEFLKSQTCVKSFSFEKGGFVAIVLQDGYKHIVKLHGAVAKERLDENLVQGRDVRFKERALTKATELRQKIEATLMHDGLILAPRNGNVFMYEGQDARQRLLAMSEAIQDCVRSEERLCGILFDEWRDGASDWTWEILLNLRERQLRQRIAEEPQPAK